MTEEIKVIVLVNRLPKSCVSCPLFCSCYDTDFCPLVELGGIGQVRSFNNYEERSPECPLILVRVADNADEEV